VIWAVPAAICAVLIGAFVFRPRMGPLYRGDFQGIKTEAILGPIITLAVFVSALVIAQANSTYQRGSQAASQEANAVELLYENAGLLPDDGGTPIQGTAICYARAVSRIEFPAVADGGGQSRAVDWWTGEFNREIPKVIDGPGSVVGQVVSLNRQQTEARASRIYDAEPHLPLFTVILMLSAVIFVVTALATFAVTDMRRGFVLGLVGALALLLGSTLFMVEQLEEPFSGIIRVKPSATEKSLDRMERSLPPGEQLPCDESGRPVPTPNPAVAAAAKAKGVEPLVGCTNVGYPPMSYADPLAATPTGYTGFSIDLAQAIADKAGRPLVIEEQPLDRQADAVDVGLCDAIVGAYTVTAEVAQEVDFTQPYFTVDLSIVVPTGSQVGTGGLDSLRGKTIGVRTASGAKSFTNDNRPVGSTVKEYATNEQLAVALRNGEVDAVLIPEPAAIVATNQDPSVTIAATVPTEQQLAYATAKDGDRATFDLLNNGITEAKADGTYAALYRKYFNEDPPAA
jgi:polar amino acid transport system substrate-binding protein